MNLFTRENLQKYLSPEGLERALLISNLQDKLMGLDDSNFEWICDNLIKSKFLRDTELTKRLVDNIFVCCKYREFYVGQYSFLLYSLYQIIQNASKIETSVKMGFVKKENINLTLFTFNYLIQKNQTCQIYSKKDKKPDLNLNVHATSRRRSLIYCESLNQNGSKIDLNEDENHIYSLINQDKTGVQKSIKIDNEENELFFNEFIMKSSLILKTFKDRLFTITMSISKQPWRLYCIYKCMQIFNDKAIFNYLEIFFNDSPTVEYEHLIVFAYFAPLIKKHFPHLYDKLYHEMKKKNHYSQLPYSFKNFLNDFKENDKSNWNNHEFNLDNCGFQIGTPQYAIRHDDVTFFINQKNQANNEFDLNYNMKVRVSIFIRYPQLKNKCTLLQLAAYYGSEKCFQFLIENGADPEIEDDIGLKVMHFAVIGGSHSIIVTLQKLGYSFDIGSISLIAECFRLSLFQWLLSVIPINFEESCLQTGTIIHRVASANNVLILLFCIANGANINVFDNLNLTPLFYAASNCSIDVINTLLAHKNVNWSLADKFLDTPLHGACKSNDCDTFIAMLNHKDADINIKDFRNRSPLKYSIGEGKFDILKMILSKYEDEVDFDEVDDLGYNLSFVHPIGAFLNTFILICECQKMDLNRPNKEGYYLIHSIVISNLSDFLRAFLNQERADTNVRSPDGSTALHIAAKNGLVEIIGYLIENKKTDVNLKDNTGFTPLHIAIRNSNTDVVRVLIQSGKIDHKVTVVLFIYIFFYS